MGPEGSVRIDTLRGHYILYSDAPPQPQGHCEVLRFAGRSFHLNGSFHVLVKKKSKFRWRKLKFIVAKTREIFRKEFDECLLALPIRFLTLFVKC